MKPLTHEWVAKAEGDFAVKFRYPGESANREIAMEARKLCRLFRNAVRETLGLEAQ